VALLGGCEGQAPDGSDGFSVFADDSTGVFRVKPDFVDVPISLFTMKDSGMLGMLDQLGDHIFEIFLDGDFYLHNGKDSAKAETTQ